ncbi:MAG: tetratricopeptide repeat protein [Candidatus Zapsychrus exili]|nr:tetratricopeptide repeat protein [Candidatus Zapsychrus exili]
MRKTLTVFLLAAICLVAPKIALAYNFGDFGSATLVNKAWQAHSQGDVEGVLAYTNKCLELYAEQAQQMQSELDSYVEGSNEKIFEKWALNDVATALFVQAEAYRMAGMAEEASKVYTSIIENYAYGQTWDAGGWFWKPAEASRDQLKIIETGLVLDFGNSSSSFLVGQAWKSLHNNAHDAVVIYVKKALELYEGEAKNMQDSLTEYPWESNDKILTYWALNDIGTALFILGESYKKVEDREGAREAYKKLINDFYYAQCWDPKGWFWKPAEVAQQALEDLGNLPDTNLERFK